MGPAGSGKVRGRAQAPAGAVARSRAPAGTSRGYRETLERTLAKACDLLISQRDPDLNEALAIIGQAAGGSRAHIWEVRDDGRVWAITHEWCVPGVRPLIDERRHLEPATDAPWWKAKLEAGETIIVPSPEALPPEALAEKRAAERWGIESMICAPIIWPGHRLIGFVGIHDTDQSNRRRTAVKGWALRAFASMVGAYWIRSEAQRAARLVTERFRLLAEQTSDPFLVVDANGILTYASPSVTRVLGYEPDEAKGKKAEDLVHSGDVERWRRAFELCTRRPRSHATVEGRLRHKDGSWRTVEARMDNFLDSPAVSGVALHIRDVTELRRLEHEVVAVCTRERETLRRELHDGIGGYFTALSMRAKTLAAKLAAGRAVAAEEAEEIAALVEQAREAAHAVSAAVCPVPPEPDGLTRALGRLAATWQQLTNTTVQFHCPRAVRLCDLAEAVQAYRIAEEAVTNAARHGGATEIAISLMEEGGVIELTIRDDGVGFDPAACKGSGLGLSIMRYRAHLLHGALDICSAPGEGTVVTLLFTPSRSSWSDGDESN